MKLTQIDLSSGHSVFVEESYNQIVNAVTLGTGTGVLEFTETFSMVMPPFEKIRSKVYIKPGSIVAVRERADLD